MQLIKLSDLITQAPDPHIHSALEPIEKPLPATTDVKRKKIGAEAFLVNIGESRDKRILFAKDWLKKLLDPTPDPGKYSTVLNFYCYSYPVLYHLTL